MLKAAVEKEKERIKTGPPSGVANSSIYVSLKADMPTWVSLIYTFTTGKIRIQEFRTKTQSICMLKLEKTT